MTVEVFGTDEFQAWFFDLSAEEQAAVVNVVTKLEISASPSGARTRRRTSRARRSRSASCGQPR